METDAHRAVGTEIRSAESARKISAPPLPSERDVLSQQPAAQIARIVVGRVQ